MTRYLIPTALLCVLVGCAPQITYDLIEIETPYDVVYSHRYKELVIVENAVEHRSLIQDTSVLIHPRFSPDGSRIAWLDIGTASLPTSSTDVTVHVASVSTSPQQGFDTPSSPLERIDLDHKLMIEDAVPIVWHPNGESFYVAHAAGIDRVNSSCEVSTLASDADVRAVAISPSGSLLVAATLQNMFEVRSGTMQPLLADDFVPQFGDKRIRSLAFAGDQWLFFSLANQIYRFDVASGEVELAFEDVQDVYWMEWLPTTDEVAYLAGQERRRGRTYSPYQDVYGEFRLNVITSGGSFQRELFRGQILDVRECVPAVSPDGAFVSLTSRPHPNNVYIVATDGSGVMQLTFDGPNSYSAWRPED